MNIRLYTSKEDSENFGRSFSTKIYPKFERSTFLFVDFSINESHKDVFKIQVFYTENGFFYTKFNSSTLIRHAFGKWNALDFMLAKEKNNPLCPLFIFDFPLDNTNSQYDAVFANVNGELHILSKIYNLSNEHFKILRKSYKLYKIEGLDCTLFDFGNCFSFIDKFLINLEAILDDVDFRLNDSDELIINPISLDSIRKREDDYKYCMICGKKLESTLNKNLLELHHKFPARCENCLKQIYALELYNKLNEGSISTTMLSISELEYIWSEEGLFEYNFKLLKDYGFLKPFSDDIYKLYLNEDINEAFSSLLNPIEEKEVESKSKNALDDYFGFNDEKEKLKCRICGEEIEEDNGTDICPNCFDKQMSIEKIQKLVEYVKPGSGFSKSSLIERGFNHIDLDIIISDLEDQGLLRYDSDDLIILTNKAKLNEFIKQYSDSDDYLVETDKEKAVSKVVILKDDLKDESLLDKSINLIEYQDYVECSSNHRMNGWNVILKKDGNPFLEQLFYNPYQAKLMAVRYLNEIGVIEIIESSDEIKEILEDVKDNKSDKKKRKSKKKSKDENKYAPPAEGRGQKFNVKCPICGREFISYHTKKNIICSSCNSKYKFFEKKALEGIIRGKFDKNVLKEILMFRENGLSDEDIAKTLNIKHDFMIKPLVKFLSDDDLLNTIEKNLSGELDSDSNNAIDEDSTSEKDGVVADISSEAEVSASEKDGVVADVSSEAEGPAFKTCPICKREFVLKGKYNSNQKYCDDCKSKYDNFELNALAGIDKGIYTEDMAIRMKELLDQGNSKSQVARMFNIKNSTLITHILKFLLNDNPEDDEPQISKDEETKDNVCPICNKTFFPRGNQKYCNDCRKKFTPLELSVLFDIEKGVYTKYTAIEIARLKQEGKTNYQIANVLKLPHPGVITPILNFLLKDAEISEEKEEEDSKKLKRCPLCEKEFIPKSSNGSDIYCPDCKKKYTPTEINLLIGVKEGKFTEELAKKFLRLQNSGFSNRYIADKYDIAATLVNPIINYFKTNAKESEGVSFNSDISKWIVKVENDGKIINLGFYDTKDEAILARENYYNNQSPNEAFNKSLEEELETTSQEDKKYLEEKPLKHLFYKDKGEDYSNVLLKGIISEKERLSIFNFISFNNCNLNKLLCERQKEDNYIFLLDLDIEKSRLGAALKDLKLMGWENGE